MRYQVELDFRGCYCTTVEAASASEAFSKAKSELQDGDGYGDQHVERIDSFQVYDERMEPQDITVD